MGVSQQVKRGVETKKQSGEQQKQKELAWMKMNHYILLLHFFLFLCLYIFFFELLLFLWYGSLAGGSFFGTRGGYGGAGTGWYHHYGR